MKGTYSQSADDLLHQLSADSADHVENFIIENRNQEAFLKIIAFDGVNNAKLERQIIQRLQFLGILGWDASQIRSHIFQGQTNAVYIGKWPQLAAIDARAEIIISPDAMQAQIKLYPAKNGGQNLKLEDMSAILKQHKISFGVDHDRLLELSQEPIFYEPLVIARGKAPVEGEDGRIVVNFGKKQVKPSPSKNQGRVDHRELGHIQSVSKDDVIATIKPASQGEDGRDIYNRQLAVKAAQTAHWKLGRNVYLSKDGQNLHASIDGRPVLESRGNIRVDEIIFLENVDYSTGNVRFPGSIVVNERIADGFSLETEGSLIIQKSVGPVTLKAKGDIILAGGFMGKDIGLIVSEKDIYARFVERGNLQAGSNIYIQEAALHSQLVAGQSIFVHEGKGDLIGGLSVAGHSIECKKLGAVVETSTQVIIGSPPGLIETINSLQQQSKQQQEILQKISINLQRIKNVASQEGWTGEKKTTFQKLKMAEKKYLELQKSTLDQLEGARKAFVSKKNSYLLVSRELYHGVEVSLGHNMNYKSPIRMQHGPLYIFLTKEQDIETSDRLPKPESVKV